MLLGRIERPQADDDGAATPPPPERRRRGNEATCCVTTKFVAIAIRLLLVVAIGGPPCKDLSGSNAAAAAGNADADGTRNNYIEAFILTKIRSRAKLIVMEEAPELAGPMHAERMARVRAALLRAGY